MPKKNLKTALTDGRSRFQNPEIDVCVRSRNQQGRNLKWNAIRKLYLDVAPNICYDCACTKYIT